MDEEQAAILLNDLIEQLNTSGYGDLVNMINIRQVEQMQLGEVAIDNTRRLFMFLNDGTEILRTLSSRRLAEILDRINTFVEYEEPLTGIRVELIDGGFYNLADLPDYQPVIELFNEIRRNLNY